MTGRLAFRNHMVWDQNLPERVFFCGADTPWLVGIRLDYKTLLVSWACWRGDRQDMTMGFETPFAALAFIEENYFTEKNETA